MYYASFLLIISIIQSKVEETEKNNCKTIQCVSDLQDNKCIKEENTMISLKECKEGFYCDIQTELTCKNINDKPKPLKYESLPCTEDKECLLEKCDNKKQCLKHPIDSLYYDCTYAYECRYGDTCLKQPDGKFCFPQKTQGKDCEEDSDCKLLHGCLNSKCTRYFSFEEGYEIKDQGTTISSFNYFHYCKSGYSHEGKCANLTLENPYQECDQSEHKCTYRYDDGTTITLPERCKCGYEGEGKSYCELGSGNHNYTSYLKALQEYYSRPEVCHIDERDKFPCLKDVLSTEQKDKMIMNTLISKRLWATKNYLMYNAEKCAIATYFPEYDAMFDEPEPLPDQIACPIYFCSNNTQESTTNNRKCATVQFYSFQFINVTLFETCQGNQVCTIDRWDPDLYKNQDIQCKEITKTKHRYPGEQCDKNEDCFLYESCEKNICQGKGNSCSSHDDCQVGQFCENSKCKDQLSLGDTCSSTYACRNDHYCYENTCQDILFTQLDKTKLLTGIEYPSPEKICQYNYQYDNECSSLISKNPLPEDEDYIECTAFSKCFYKLSTNEDIEVLQNCSCNYNREGKQYCPHDHYQDSIMLKRYLKALKKSYDNKCHTKKRYNCDLLDEGIENEIKMYQNHVDQGHMFYKSELCAEKVLQGQYNKCNTLLWLMLIIILTI